MAHGLLAAAATACVVNLEIPFDTDLTCDSDDQCQTGKRCVQGAGRCAAPDEPCIEVSGDTLSAAPDGSACALDEGVGSCAASRCVALCGDQRVGGAETCDAGQNTGTCDSDCTDVECGDGHVNALAGEACDPGVDGEWCTAACRVSSALSAGLDHACAVLDTGDLRCWGGNDFGSLGLGDQDYRGDYPDEMGTRLPVVRVGSDMRVAEVAAGGLHTCIRSFEGQVKCWGSGFRGQIGRVFSCPAADSPDCAIGDQPGEMGENLAPLDFGVELRAVVLRTGYDHNCLVDEDGVVRCWGLNDWGQLGHVNTWVAEEDPGYNEGDDPGEMAALTPFPLDGQRAVALALGGYHTCVLTEDDVVMCHGSNQDNQLGQPGAGNEVGSLLDADAFGGSAPQQIAAGFEHTCALLLNGEVRCWGRNDGGQLGLGHTDPWGLSGDLARSDAAVDLGTGRTATAIDCGGHHSCAVLDDGSLKCWGINTCGQLGQGDRDARGHALDTMGDDLLAVDLGTALGGGDASVRALSAGGEFTCVHLDDGRIKCWGSNARGQLGQGDLFPVPVNDPPCDAVLGDDPAEMGDALPEVDLSVP